MTHARAHTHTHTHTHVGARTRQGTVVDRQPPKEGMEKQTDKYFVSNVYTDVCILISVYRLSAFLICYYTINTDQYTKIYIESVGTQQLPCPYRPSFSVSYL